MNIADIVTTASTRAIRGEPKPFDIIRDAIAASKNEVAALSEAEMAILYRHFMPKTARAAAGVFDASWMARELIEDPSL